MAFIPRRQNYSDAMILHVRTGGDPAQALAAARQALREIDPPVPGVNSWTIAEVIDQSLGRRSSSPCFSPSRRARSGPRLDRPLRGHGLQREPAEPGDRSSHGARRGARRRPGNGAQAGDDPRGARDGSGSCSRSRDLERRRHHSIWNRPRPADVRRGSRDSEFRRPSREPDSRPSGQPGRSPLSALRHQ